MHYEHNKTEYGMKFPVTIYVGKTFIYHIFVYLKEQRLFLTLQEWFYPPEIIKCVINFHYNTTLVFALIPTLDGQIQWIVEITHKINHQFGLLMKGANNINYAIRVLLLYYAFYALHNTWLPLKRSMCKT